MKRTKKFLKAAAFVLAFLAIFNVVSDALVCPNDYRNWQWVGEFYETEEDSLDAVYIGSSAVYAFWVPSYAFEQNGITVWNYTTGRQSIHSVEYIIKDCRKTQKDALYIVNLNRVSSDYNKASIHYLIDYMPFSFNKLMLTKTLCDGLDIESEDRLQYYFPLDIYHTRWSSLTDKDFNYGPDGTKGSANYYSFLWKSVSGSEHQLAPTGEARKFDDYYLEPLNSLLDYCEKENVKVLFTINPQLSEVGDRYSEVCYAKELVMSRGFDVVDYWENAESTGLQVPQDFYNDRHANIHGALKMTRLLADYLTENYGFEDKRGKEGYEDWDASFETYYNDVIGKAVVPLELEGENRDYSLSAVSISSAAYDKTVINVSFSECADADGYAVYRKTINNKKGTQSSYRELLTLEKGQTSFSDSDFNAAADGTYSFNYIIVPFKNNDGNKLYGCFNYSGTKVDVK